MEELEQRERAEVTRMREHFGEQLTRRGIPSEDDDGIIEHRHTPSITWTCTSSVMHLTLQLLALLPFW